MTAPTLHDLLTRLNRFLTDNAQVPEATLVVRLDDGTYARVTSVDIAWSGVPASKITRQGVLEATR